MTEKFRYPPDAVTAYLHGIRFPHASYLIDAVYPVAHENRIVLRMGGTVYKVRRYTEEARHELEQASMLWRYYQSIHIPGDIQVWISDTYPLYCSIGTPYLGEDITALAAQRTGTETIREPFTRTDDSQNMRLLNMLEDDQTQIYREFGLVHLDLFSDEPNNIVYNPLYDQLFMVDAEALVPLTERTRTTFLAQKRRLRDWFMQADLQLTAHS